ncbi:endocuticle structural glycoprotein SgAbd-2-like [Diprion similis]|uniref:endocuticle structural glycoprotein SgAbd-2-like n=1 Tax=Diprion similis TaxID=362088 RepID=UPI001EF8663A|nr:endocuticle structural glycoprotein SgAbd-2-like [Diprion similis]
MKFLIVSLGLVVVASAQYQGNQYKESASPNARILNQDFQSSPDGSYQWSYDTDNGIAAGARGVPVNAGPNGEGGIEEQGSYQYTAPDGQVIVTKYVAGPNGFIAEGPHLPVAPPIPEAILRSLAFNAANSPKEVRDYKTPQVAYQPTTQQPFRFSPTPYPVVSQQPNYYNPGYNQQSYQQFGRQ